MTVQRKNRDAMIDIREVRAVPIGQVEIRADPGSNTLTLTGYASTFEPYEIYGGPAAGGWIEQIDPHAFAKTLRLKPDLHLLINHTGMPLARTKSGTLQLSADNVGLKVAAQLDRDDPDVQRLETKMRRGDMDEMSFAFRVRAQTWSAAPGFDDPQSYRLITEVSLQKGDVSVVNFGANPTTTAELLGRRTKQENGMKKTLSRAEALALVAADSKTMPRSRPTASTGRSVAAAQRQADAADASWRAQEATSDAIVARARQLLDGLGYANTQPADSYVAEAIRNHRPETGFGSVISPPLCELIKAADRDDLRARREARLAELDRQRAAITNPERTGWPYGSRSATMSWKLEQLKS